MTFADGPATVGFAVAAGAATFFAPCAYPLLPGYVGYYVDAVGDEGTPVGGAVLRGIAASAGVLAVFGAVAALAVAAGRAVVAHLTLLEPVVGAGFVVLGTLVLAGRSPSLSVRLPRRRHSVLGFVAFGGVYALAAAGCTVPVFAALLAKAITLPPAWGVAAVAGYAGGMGLLLVGATVAIAVGYDLGVDRHPRYAAGAKRLAGAIIVLAGLAQLYRSALLLGVVQ